jgi:uncharacterized protein
MSPPDFQAFQHAFGRHLRDPHHTPRPPGVPARRMAVYNELLFNNITGSLDACFPLCRTLLGDIRWRRLNRTFFRDWKSPTPWFREIPREFVRYLNEYAICQPLPAWFAELAHYEWIELVVDTMDCPIPPHDPVGNLMRQPIVLNPALRLLAYAWPVQRICPDFRPRKSQPTQLVVYRDAEDRVRFVATNPVTARLLALLGAQPTGGEAACRQIAAELQRTDPAPVIAFGADLLDDLRRQGIVLGTAA